MQAVLACCDFQVQRYKRIRKVWFFRPNPKFHPAFFGFFPVEFNADVLVGVVAETGFGNQAGKEFLDGADDFFPFGSGGFQHALRQSGIEILFVADIEKI